MLRGRSNKGRFQVWEFNDEGTTTARFDIVVLNKISRYHLAIDALKHDLGYADRRRM
jgi:xylulose-5-phosphate/fructose-6-phosphate phosphoketolase